MRLPWPWWVTLILLISTPLPDRQWDRLLGWAGHHKHARFV
jgi:hypothetical protein